MIVLLEPGRPPGFVSGGYRYQDEVMRRLAATGRGRQVAIEPDKLRETVGELRDEEDITIVADGLFLARTGVPLPAGVTALLHMGPDLQPWAEEPLHVIATSAATADAVAAAARSVSVVRPGLDECFVPPNTPPSNRRIRVVCVGTVCAAKGQRLVAEALALAAPDRCEFVLLGDTATDPEYVDEVRDAAGSVALTLTGCIPPDAVAAELQRTDLLVSASQMESFGMAVAEAVACDVPVLAFDTGEIRSFVEHGSNGWLVAPGSESENAELARRLAHLVEQPGSLAAARTSASGRPRGAGWDQVAAEFGHCCTGTERT